MNNSNEILDLTKLVDIDTIIFAQEPSTNRSVCNNKDDCSNSTNYNVCNSPCPIN